MKLQSQVIGSKKHAPSICVIHLRVNAGLKYLNYHSGPFFDLKAGQLDKLCHAMQHHSGGYVHTCATIQSCWDSDRLDLGRVGIHQHKEFLS
jgi:hypothetical protein